MNKIYNWFGGRKIYYLNLILLINTLLLSYDKWNEGFGWFTVGLYATVVLGIEGNKFIKTKSNNSEV
jgi:hypothetical protein